MEIIDKIPLRIKVLLTIAVALGLVLSVFYLFTEAINGSDLDGDGVADPVDNCKYVQNQDQADSDPQFYIPYDYSYSYSYFRQFDGDEATCKEKDGIWCPDIDISYGNLCTGDPSGFGCELAAYDGKGGTVCLGAGGNNFCAGDEKCIDSYDWCEISPRLAVYNLSTGKARKVEVGGGTYKQKGPMDGNRLPFIYETEAGDFMRYYNVLTKTSTSIPSPYGSPLSIAGMEGNIISYSYSDGDGENLAYYDISSGISTQIIPPESYHGVSLVWNGIDDGIIIYNYITPFPENKDKTAFFNTATGESTQIVPPGNYYSKSYAIDNGKIVYGVYEAGGGEDELYYYDISTGQSTKIVPPGPYTNVYISADESYKTIDNNIIIYQYYNEGRYYSAYYNIGTASSYEITIPDGEISKFSDVDGNIILLDYIEETTGESKIGYYNILTNTFYPIDLPQSSWSVAIKGNFILYRYVPASGGKTAFGIYNISKGATTALEDQSDARDVFSATGDGIGNVCDVCPNDPTNQCNPNAAQELIDSKTGGTIFTVDGEAVIYIPSEALPENEVVTVEESGSNFRIDVGGVSTPIAVSYELLPSGLNFTADITITIYFDPGVLDPAIAEVYYSPDGVNWQAHNRIIERGSNYIKFLTDHFSVFGVGGGTISTRYTHSPDPNIVKETKREKDEEGAGVPEEPEKKPEEAKEEPREVEVPEAPKYNLYTVRAGDFLAKIAREVYGDPKRWKELIELNKDKYPSLETNPHLIYAGWIFRY